MSQSDAEEAVLTAVKTALGAIPIEGENLPVTVPDGCAKWAQVDSLGSNPVPATVGTHGYDRVDVVTQVTLHYPLRTGTAQSRLDYEAMRSAFSAGKVLTYNGQAATVRSCGKAKGRKSEKDFIVPISITWFAFLTR